MWLVITLVAILALCTSQILDKLLVTKKVSDPGVMTFWIALGQLAGIALIFWNFNFQFNYSVLAIALCSGIFYVVAMQFYYHAIKGGEASHLVPFVGGLVPLVITLASRFLLNENLNNLQYAGIVVASLGTLLIGFENTKGKFVFSRSSLLALCAAIFFGLSHVFAKWGYVQDTFSTVFVIARFGAFFAIIPLLFSRNIRVEIFKKSKAKKHGGYLYLLAANMILAIIYFIGIQYAFSLAGASIVSGVGTLEYALFIVLIFIISRYFPKIIKEKFYKKEIIVQVISICLIIAGTVLMLI